MLCFVLAYAACAGHSDDLGECGDIAFRIGAVVGGE